MGCIIEGKQSFDFSVKFTNHGYKQSILIDMILRYHDKSMKELADVLDITVEKLIEVYEGHTFLPESQADDLSQFFLVFFGQKIYSNFSVKRNFDYSANDSFVSSHSVNS